ncbi:ArsR/SmtB family transcription factor [Urechidicola sp. KH5]
MGVTKNQIFTATQNEIALYAKVLGHPARISILEHIGKIDGCICNDLVDEIGLAQATISQHLKELKNVGIIKGSISGKKVCYCLDETQLASIKNQLNQFFSKLDACCNTSC